MDILNRLGFGFWTFWVCVVCISCASGQHSVPISLSSLGTNWNAIRNCPHADFKWVKISSRQGKGWLTFLRPSNLFSTPKISSAILTEFWTCWVTASGFSVYLGKGIKKPDGTWTQLQLFCICMIYNRSHSPPVCWFWLQNSGSLGKKSCCRTKMRTNLASAFHFTTIRHLWANHCRQALMTPYSIHASLEQQKLTSYENVRTSTNRICRGSSKSIANLILYRLNKCRVAFVVSQNPEPMSVLFETELHVRRIGWQSV